MTSSVYESESILSALDELFGPFKNATDAANHFKDCGSLVYCMEPCCPEYVEYKGLYDFCDRSEEKDVNGEYPEIIERLQHHLGVINSSLDEIPLSEASVRTYLDAYLFYALYAANTLYGTEKKAKLSSEKNFRVS